MTVNDDKHQWNPSNLCASSLQSEREKSEARFSKLKLQAKAKITSLSKQIDDFKGQGGATVSPESNLLHCLYGT